MNTTTKVLGLTATATTVLALGGLAPAATASSASCAGHPATMVVTARSPHVVHGTSHRDVIVIRSAGHVVRAGGGRDLVCGSAGHDVVLGGGGADRLRGRGGDDVLRGGTGDDTLRGGDGDDTLFGDDGADDLDGQAGEDRCDGGTGDDSEVGEHVSDVDDDSGTDNSGSSLEG